MLDVNEADDASAGCGCARPGSQGVRFYHGLEMILYDTLLRRARIVKTWCSVHFFNLIFLLTRAWLALLTTIHLHNSPSEPTPPG
jgi:hypothetical protein